MPSIFLLITMLLSASLGHGQEARRKVVFIIADGIPADLIEKCPVPALRQMAGKEGWLMAYVGGEKSNYSQTPTISAVGYNSLLTGTWANKHNVWDNDIKAPNYAYPTIFWYLKQFKPESRLGVYSTWTSNRKLLVGDSLAATEYLHVDDVADGYELDTIQFPHDLRDEYIHRIDELVAQKAADGIRKNAPDLSWVYLQYTDDVGHQSGDGSRMENAIGMLDKQVAKIWDAVSWRQKHLGEDWLFIVTTDHGRDSLTGKHHGGQSERERRTWIFTNARDINKYFYKNPPGIVDILPTIAQFLKVSIPRNYIAELDGISLIGKISIVNPQAILAGDSIKVSWRALEKSGKVRIW
ncbi:MAG: alkaline phosphatase family protein, partial [Chitinophagales bacterium]